MNKKNLGQFFTTRSEYIIGNLLDTIPHDALVVDPFAGNMDLLKIITNKKICLDIDPVNESVIKNDSLLNPIDYTGKWVVTNPPYLAKNKNTDKTSPYYYSNLEAYSKYNQSDLYKAALQSLSKCEGGILIVPVNFLCEESNSCRTDFFNNFKIIKINIFEENVFDDTSYSVCSFSFIKSEKEMSRQIIPCIFFPSNLEINLDLKKEYGFRAAGQFYDRLKTSSSLHVSRLIKGDVPNSKIKLRAIDTGSDDGRISLFIDDYFFDETPLRTERTFCTLKFDINFSEKEQNNICVLFNNFLEKNRKKYNSLFLTNYRNSTKNYARKRIGFDSAYKIITYLVEKNKHLFSSYLNSKKD